MMPASPTSPSPIDPVALAAKIGRRIRQEIVLAHFVGKMTVDRGAREARHHLSAVLNSTPAPTATSDDFLGGGHATTDDDTSVSTDLTPDDLALSDYDHLPSAHIVAKLDSLDRHERDAIEAYETAGRHRRTILGKLARLREAEAS